MMPQSTAPAAMPNLTPKSKVAYGVSIRPFSTMCARMVQAAASARSLGGAVRRFQLPRRTIRGEESGKSIPRKKGDKAALSINSINQRFVDSTHQHGQRFCAVLALFHQLGGNGAKAGNIDK